MQYRRNVLEILTETLHDIIEACRTAELGGHVARCEDWRRRRIPGTRLSCKNPKKPRSPGQLGQKLRNCEQIGVRERQTYRSRACIQIGVPEGGSRGHLLPAAKKRPRSHNLPVTLPLQYPSTSFDLAAKSGAASYPPSGTCITKPL